MLIIRTVVQKLVFFWPHTVGSMGMVIVMFAVTSHGSLKSGWEP